MKSILPKKQQTAEEKILGAVSPKNFLGVSLYDIIFNINNILYISDYVYIYNNRVETRRCLIDQLLSTQVKTQLSGTPVPFFSVNGLTLNISK